MKIETVAYCDSLGNVFFYYYYYCGVVIRGKIVAYRKRQWLLRIHLKNYYLYF